MSKDKPKRIKAHVIIKINAFIPSLNNPEKGDAIEAEPFAFTVSEGENFKPPAGLVTKIRNLLIEMAKYAQKHEPKEPTSIITPKNRIIDADGNPMN